MTEPRGEYVVAEGAARQTFCDWCREPVTGIADHLEIEVEYASADRSETAWSEKHSRWFCSRRCLDVWLASYANDAVAQPVVSGETMTLQANMLRALAACETVPVLGMPDLVAVRVPRALWALIREEGA